MDGSWLKALGEVIQTEQCRKDTWSGCILAESQASIQRRDNALEGTHTANIRENAPNLTKKSPNMPKFTLNLHRIKDETKVRDRGPNVDVF